MNITGVENINVLFHDCEETYPFLFFLQLI